MKKKTISILCPVKNRVQTIKRAIDSLVSQTYPHKQIIVQDAASTDGTLEILQSYGSQIELVSEPDSGPEEGFSRALKRVRGDYFIFILSDEELLPGSLEWAIKQFSIYPNAAAIYGDGYVTDFEGNIKNYYHTVPWDLKIYLCQKVYPIASSTFFSKSHYDSLHLDFINTEFDIFLRLGVRYPIFYINYPVSKCSVHTEALSQTIRAIEKARLTEIETIKLVLKDPSLAIEIRELENPAIAGSYLVGAECFLITYEKEQMEAIKHAASFLKKSLPYLTSLNYDLLKRVSLTLAVTGLKLIKNGLYREALECLNPLLEVPLSFIGVNFARSMAFRELRLEDAAKKSLELEQKALLNPQSIILRYT